MASDPEVRREVAHYAATALTPGPELEHELSDGDLQRIADEARLRTGALFVVITDDQGIRLAHPDRARLGEMVSTDPSRVLAGSEVVTAPSASPCAPKSLCWNRPPVSAWSAR